MLPFLRVSRFSMFSASTKRNGIIYIIFDPTLKSQKLTSRHSEGGQFLCEAIPVRRVQATTHVRQEFVDGIIQFGLIFRGLGAQQVVLVGRKAGFTGKHKTEHGSHDRPVILRGAKQQEIEQSSSQTRKEIRLGRQVLEEYGKIR